MFLGGNAATCTQTQGVLRRENDREVRLNRFPRIGRAGLAGHRKAFSRAREELGLQPRPWALSWALGGLLPEAHRGR